MGRKKERFLGGYSCHFEKIMGKRIAGVGANVGENLFERTLENSFFFFFNN